MSINYNQFGLLIILLVGAGVSVGYPVVLAIWMKVQMDTMLAVLYDWVKIWMVCFVVGDQDGLVDLIASNLTG